MIRSEERGIKDNGTVEKTRQGMVRKGRCNDVTDTGTTNCLHLMCSPNINPAPYVILWVKYSYVRKFHYKKHTFVNFSLYYGLSKIETVVGEVSTELVCAVIDFGVPNARDITMSPIALF
jgi:hypothetical protein